MEEKKFEEMRNQFAILKEQLNKQEIVNDHLLRKAMKSKNKEISRTKRVVFVSALSCLIIFPMTYMTHMWSLGFAIATIAMVAFSAAATYYIHKPIEELNFMKDDFSTVARVMAKFKKQYDNWLRYVAPTLIIPWLIWGCYEFAWKNAPDGINPWLMSLPLIVGVIIGGLIGVKFHFKAVNAAQDILDQIEES